MKVRLFRRRSLYWPTLQGWIVVALFIVLPSLFWCFCGESFLSLTDRQPADVLVVEGWIGPNAIRAAALEFYQSHYRLLVTTGGLTGDAWSPMRWTYAIEARGRLIHLGISPNMVVAAIPRETDQHRTYEAALACSHTIQLEGLKPRFINVFTESVHARRSRLTFAKVMGPSVKVGVISWRPPGYEDLSWWQSSTRAVDFMKETVGYFYEVLLNSGRHMRAPATPSDSKSRDMSGRPATNSGRC